MFRHNITVKRASFIYFYLHNVSPNATTTFLQFIQCIKATLF